MTMSKFITQRLANLDIVLPTVPSPVANYVPYLLSEKHLFISGQLPMFEGKMKYAGRIGSDLSIKQGQEAARLCGINIIAQAHAACNGDLERIVRCLKLGGFVHSKSNFTDHSTIINGASDLIINVFDEKGMHTRFAVGASSLPLNASVQVDAIFEVTVE